MSERDSIDSIISIHLLEQDQLGEAWGMIIEPYCHAYAATLARPCAYRSNQNHLYKVDKLLR